MTVRTVTIMDPHPTAAGPLDSSRSDATRMPVTKSSGNVHRRERPIERSRSRRPRRSLPVALIGTPAYGHGTVGPCHNRPVGTARVAGRARNFCAYKEGTAVASAAIAREKDGRGSQRPHDVKSVTSGRSTNLSALRWAEATPSGSWNALMTPRARRGTGANISCATIGFKGPRLLFLHGLSDLASAGLKQPSSIPPMHNHPRGRFPFSFLPFLRQSSVAWMRPSRWPSREKPKKVNR